ncbi:D-alanyl-D-alanine carboxypeptidase family protein [Cellulomonas sp. APG4]|uniref:D-alanyl-D-alanine carboxypeptidase family protein n=1 Tax=Cellulomonas sp. APG4 TaxID=1538656 RepID=UPI00351B999C
MALNGLLPAALLSPAVPGPAGARLEISAALSWARLCADVERRYGWTPQITSAGDAYRSYEIQERIFRQRYTTAGPTAVDWVGKSWRGARWYRLPIWAAAATPGTSNHGRGVAVDITGLGGFAGTRYRQLAAVAAEHGWDNNEGRAIAEAWHWVYKARNDTHRGGGLPAPLTPEDDTMSKEDVDELKAELEDLKQWLAEVFRVGNSVPNLSAAIMGSHAYQQVRDPNTGKVIAVTTAISALLGMVGRLPGLTAEQIEAAIHEATPAAGVSADDLADELARRLTD